MTSKRSHATANSALKRDNPRGPLMPIGGAEAKDCEQIILERFLQLSLSRKPKILIIPTASEDPVGTGERYQEVFGQMGAKDPSVLDVSVRADANDDRAVDLVMNSTGIFITGGDQSRLVTLLVGTRVMDAIRERNEAGVIVAGTSAGASIIADHLLVGGTDLAANSNDATARRSLVELSAGFALLRDAVIDQHFSARGRIGRLLSAFAATPGLVGLGIDEATAALISADGILEVLGIGSVTILDGRDTVSDYAERSAGELLSLADVSLHVLAPGRRFDLTEHRPRPFEETRYNGPSADQVMRETVRTSSATRTD